jgi:hypothetical protein
MTSAQKLKLCVLGRLAATSLSGFLIDITVVITILVFILFIAIPNKFKIRYFKFRNN